MPPSLPANYRRPFSVFTQSLPLPVLYLGALGGLCGFFTSGLVHYNWGDSEVVMIFYCVVGLTLALERKLMFAE